MDKYQLNFVSRYQPDLQELLSCSKQFTLKRENNLKCKNRVYYKNTSIKCLNYHYSKNNSIIYQEVWYKNGKFHRNERDPVTGILLPAAIIKNGIPVWYKNGFCISSY